MAEDRLDLLGIASKACAHDGLPAAVLEDRREVPPRHPPEDHGARVRQQRLGGRVDAPLHGNELHAQVNDALDGLRELLPQCLMPLEAHLSRQRLLVQLLGLQRVSDHQHGRVAHLLGHLAVHPLLVDDKPWDDTAVRALLRHHALRQLEGRVTQQALLGHQPRRLRRQRRPLVIASGRHPRRGKQQRVLQPRYARRRLLHVPDGGVDARPKPLRYLRRRHAAENVGDALFDHGGRKDRGRRRAIADGLVLRLGCVD